MQKFNLCSGEKVIFSNPPELGHVRFDRAIVDDGTFPWKCGRTPNSSDDEGIDSRLQRVDPHCSIGAQEMIRYEKCIIFSF